MSAFSLKQPVRKVGGDYQFEGHIVAIFEKLSGLVRYVVEDDRGVLHVYSARNLEARLEPVTTGHVDFSLIIHDVGGQ